MRGVVRRYLSEKRYGFILSEDGNEEVFFHHSVFDALGGPPPITGEAVVYTLSEGTRAASVTRDEPPVHRTGTVSSYDPVRGFGFINTVEGQCYLHKSEIIGGVIPAVGSRVDFYTTGNSAPGKSPRACYVAVLQ